VMCFTLHVFPSDEVFLGRRRGESGGEELPWMKDECCFGSEHVLLDVCICMCIYHIVLKLSKMYSWCLR
jgi:hypothetical protein